MGYWKKKRKILAAKGIKSSTGVTVDAGGVTVTAGGATITAGGLTVTAGGITNTAGNLAMTAGGVDLPVSTGTTGTDLANYGVSMRQRRALRSSLKFKMVRLHWHT